jgi:predicted P-loop ATPase
MAIRLKYNDTIDIATAKSRKATKWHNKRIEWQDLLAQLEETERTPETLKQYFSYTKDKQDEIKDVGGFVGGYLIGGQRKKDTVEFRQIVCLDIDYAGVEVWEDFVIWGNAGAMYSTHKHQPSKPRLRLIFPLDRPVNPDEYEAIARKVASWLGIDAFDDTTYQPSRLMYYPSTSKDGQYLFAYEDGPWMSADEVLADYHDWQDPTTWPVSSRVAEAVQHASNGTVEDPTTKAGIIGAFCRAFTIPEAIAEFLPDVYDEALDMGSDRYTYVNGSTSGGLVVYGDVLAYSNHSTDPAGGKTCNAFDLVRLHKFGDLDDGRDVKDPTRLPSYKAMADFASKMKAVKREILAERSGNVMDYDAVADESREVAGLDEWLENLETEKSGAVKNTIANVVLILSYDPALAGKFGYNDFDQRETAVLPLPWDKETRKYPRALEDADDAQLRLYLERAYGITGKGQITDGLTVVLRNHRYHPVKDYLNALEWDGVERLDELFITVLGAADNAYTRAVTRKAFTAAVARIYRPGIKFDQCTIIAGDQGAGKSTLLDRMGGEWFNDSLTNVEGKDALEVIQGSWIIELGEMAGMRRAQVDTQKQFISKRVDKFRVAYGKRTEEFPRRCVFFATTNEGDFLRDVTGNRRFWVINVMGRKGLVDAWDYLDEEIVAQLWAEAKVRYEAGEELRLVGKLEVMAKLVQDEHLEKDERLGLVGEYLRRLLPEDWDNMEPYARRQWLGEEKNVGTVERDSVCMLEIWTECLGKDATNITRKDSFELGRLLKSLRGWTPSGKATRVNWYGSQKVYRRILVT